MSWIPLIAAAILLFGGATAAAIVLTQHDRDSSDIVSPGTSETGEFAEDAFEEEEFEEPEPPPSPAQLAQGQIQHALTAHFNRLASGYYHAAYADLTPREGEEIGGEAAWVAAQEEDQLQSFDLQVSTSLFDQHSAQATIVEFETHALTTGCNDWSGYWEMKKIYGEWLISAAKLEKESC